VGPPDSVYENGVFFLNVLIAGYPWKPPKIKFITPIYHPNIDLLG
jgi:ubiquitin-protein ligase